MEEIERVPTGAVGPKEINKKGTALLTEIETAMEKEPIQGTAFVGALVESLSALARGEMDEDLAAVAKRYPGFKPADFETVLLFVLKGSEDATNYLKHKIDNIGL